MGKLRTAIVDLQKLIVNNPVKIEALKKELKPGSDQISTLGNTAVEGWDLIYMHLTNKFKAQGSTTAANSKKTLKELMDPELGKLIKGVEEWRKSMHTMAAKYGNQFSAGMKDISDDLAAAATEVQNLRTIANKKKSKWLASSKYKAKIKGYLEVIDDLETLTNKQTKEMSKVRGLSFNEAWVNKYFGVRLDMTVSDVEGKATMNVQGIMKTYLENQAEADTYVTKWRDEYKSMASQLKSMKAWSDDADTMEKED